MVPKKIEQLEQWPEPATADAVVSFLCFVSYLRDFLPLEWLECERVPSVFRKKGCDFSIWKKDPKYNEAFLKLRTLLNKNCVLHHPRLDEAAHPEESGCPFKMFIDASDYAWAAVLTQREVPHGAPKIVHQGEII